MKKLYLLIIAAFIMIPLGSAEVQTEVHGNQAPVCSAGPANTSQVENTSGRGLGDALWAFDVEIPTDDQFCLGVEFDGTNFWVTGTGNFTDPYIAEIDPSGTLINKYPQPAGNIGYWGFRDLAWDGQYLYAGDDTANPGYICQIDPADGAVLDRYGPFPVVPCRALAYDPVEDAFWTASWSSKLYKCYKDGSSQDFTNPVAAIYGAAADTSTPDTKIWWYAQDSPSHLQAHEMLTDGTFTGRMFDGDDTFFGGGRAGGAAIYKNGDDWEFVGMTQGDPDHVVGYDLDIGPVDSLEASPSEVSAWYGGTLSLSLNGGPDLAGRPYTVLGSVSGTTPGFELPSGVIIGINWDWMSNLLLYMALEGGYGIVNDFLGSLDANGFAEATLIFRGHCQLSEDFDIYFAWCTSDNFDFASNSVQATILGKPMPPDSYVWDDGSSENALGWKAGGMSAWVHSFDSGVGDTIVSVSSTFGSSLHSSGPANGTAVNVYVWSDPNQDGEPSDAALLAHGSGVVDHTDTNTFNHYGLDVSTPVVGKFFVGCVLYQPVDILAAPMDEDTYEGTAYFCGGPSFDPYNMAASGIYEMGAIGYASNWLLRANDL